MSERRVLGADVCSTGWVGVATGPDATAAHFGHTIRELLTVAEVGGDIDRAFGRRKPGPLGPG
jgi:hypothetical protein